MAHAGDATAATPLLSSPKTKSTDGDEPPPPPCRNTYAFFCATLASMTTILLGYNLALMSGAQLFIREDLGLSDAQVEVLAGSINVFMLGSILAAGWAADALGRRGTLVLANVSLMAGALAMSLGASFPALLLARWVTSVGAGFSVVVTSVYNAEISPPSMRGFVSSFLDPWVATQLRVELRLRRPASTPRVARNVCRRRAPAGAPRRRRALHAGVTAVASDARLPRRSPCRTPAHLGHAGRGRSPPSEIKHAIHKDPHASDGDSVWKEILVRPSASVRRILICVVGVHFFQQASGIDAIVLYSPLVFKHAGMSSNAAVLGATVGIGVVKMCFVLVAALFCDRLGRRPLLLASTSGVAASMASLGVALCVGGGVGMAATVASVLAFMAAFSVGFGPVAGTYSAEIMPLRLRAQGASLGMAVNRLTCALVSMTFISLADAITMPGCFFLYAGVAAAACMFVYARMPETRGRSLEDMDVLFAK
ncbi:unnamed protein product [Urochloa decumbens]|uniref:Major facilitator superfamily (MFS) profile domain-containing protein n=1 Tax=Urochloa decumbens TaxID=240449 RepID=A0ABC9B090_9POAL